jgi:hypothetical protein
MHCFGQDLWGEGFLGAACAMAVGAGWVVWLSAQLPNRRGRKLCRSPGSAHADRPDLGVGTTPAGDFASVRDWWRVWDGPCRSRLYSMTLTPC